MAGKRNARHAPKPPKSGGDQPATLKDMLSPEILNKLKAQADALKADEAQRIEDQRIRKEEAKKAEQQRLDNDFGYLLNQSTVDVDWRKHK
ncbi:hypothetical protein SY83_17350 [Paenibacillus swuensis]|uniref:DUF3886 domain-containing protein n=1 Tax=Paenibacillus swuensis TaxID=1178515 RepID=A0A172TLG7_9BACL|nr:YqkE family protein [Paenibacillus swuensis]ANE47754.1 hypothetical protein SY83_17350 [Paenibacillus swuensis]